MPFFDGYLIGDESGPRGVAIFEDFEQRFLRQDVQGVLIGQLLAPWNWALLASPFFERSDLIARYFDRHGSASPLAARDPTCQNLPRSFHEAGFRGLRAA